MGFWPFGGGKKKSRNTTSPSEETKRSLIEKPDPETMARAKIPAQKGPDQPTRSTSKRGRDDKSRKLSKTRNDPYKSPSSQNLPRSQTALSCNANEYSEKTAAPPPPTTQPPRQLYQQNPISQSSIGPEIFTAQPDRPTLYARRNEFDPNMPRKKSSKRKAEDNARERELRAMTSEPSVRNKLKRPVTYSGSGPLQRDTRNIPGPLNKRLSRPDSQVSLPLPENISEPDLPKHSFRVGAIAALSPRPTLKSYQFDSSRSPLGKQPLRLPTVEQSAEEEEELPLSKQRISELADDLGSSALRELMERDRRRKEKKKESDRSKLQRKLQRRADRQREEETRRARAEEFVSSSQAHLEAQTSSSPVPDGSPGPAIPGASAVETEDAAKIPLPVGDDPFADPPKPAQPSSQAIRNPFEDENDPDVMDLPPEHEDDAQPPIPVKSPLRQVQAEETPFDVKPAQATLSPPTSPVQQPIQEPQQASKATRNITPELAESIERDRRSSDQSSQQLSTWTSFFRRGGRRKPSVTDRGKQTPSEFSNTSRESFAARKQAPPAVPPARTFRKSESGTPQRTFSKFREDLPERFPISPPDSRVQSPEVAPASQGADSSLSSRQARQSLSGTLDARSLATSSSIPTLDRGRPDSRLQYGQLDASDNTGAATTGHTVSQSLASVDSEGSWLSGKPVNRLSGPLSKPVEEVVEATSASTPGGPDPEDEGLVDDEYLSRLSPAPENRQESTGPSERKASSTLIDLQKERDREPSPTPEVPPLPKDKDETWHEGVARRPTVIKQAARAKSSEGLLKDLSAESGAIEGDDDDDNSNGEGEGEVEEPVQLMRARSVEYRGHARQISAGSAKLLDIRRASVVSTDTPPKSPGVPLGASGLGKESESRPS